MSPLPQCKGDHLKHADKFREKVAIIRGGDSGIGRAVTIAFAREGADVCILYINENSDAAETKDVVEELGVK